VLAAGAGRRAFLRGRRAAAVPRPPWARPEPFFVDRCTRCDACIDACPEAVLTRGDGGLVELRFDAGGCTFCAACLDACGSGALDRDAARDWNWHAAIDHGCLARHGVLCSSCADVCAERAIEFDLRLAMPIPALDADRCNGCSACVAVCPSSSINMRQRGGAT
jgi:ferredoxin-type protein NapF